MELIAQNSLVPIITNLRYVKRYWYFLYSVHNLRCWFESTSLGLSSLFFTSQTFQSYFLLSWNFHKGTFSYRGGFQDVRKIPRITNSGLALSQGGVGSPGVCRWGQHPSRKTLGGEYSMEVVGGRAGKKSVCDLWSALSEYSQPLPFLPSLTFEHSCLQCAMLEPSLV